jgi:hypothetical protein
MLKMCEKYTAILLIKLSNSEFLKIVCIRIDKQTKFRIDKISIELLKIIKKVLDFINLLHIIVFYEFRLALLLHFYYVFSIFRQP